MEWKVGQYPISNRKKKIYLIARRDAGRQKRFCCSCPNERELGEVMKIVLQNVETLAFFGRADEWTTDLDEACGFADAVEALDFATAKEVSGARVVMAFGDRQFELHTTARARSLERSRF